MSFSSMPSLFSRSFEDISFHLFAAPIPRRTMLADEPLRIVDKSTCLQLELETALARSVSERGDTAVITETGAIERHAFHAGSLGLLGDRLAHRGGGRFVLGALQILG